jgi:AICAR transformylase/IMP cyclohydrolase PurH
VEASDDIVPVEAKAKARAVSADRVHRLGGPLSLHRLCDHGAVMVSMKNMWKRYLTADERQREAIKHMLLKREVKLLTKKVKRKNVRTVSGGLPSLGKRR